MMAAAAATQSVRWRAATSPSGSVVWRTPEALFLALAREFDFTIDAAADDGNTKCDRHFDSDIDALAQSWAGERVFCNPPYGRELERWVKKGMLSAQDDGALVVMVLPSRTGNIWFHRYVLPYAEVRFIQGRLNFQLGGPHLSRAPFDSMVVIFRPYATAGTLRTQSTFPGFER